MYFTMHHVFNSLLGVWSRGQTTSFMFDTYYFMYTLGLKHATEAKPQLRLLTLTYLLLQAE